MKKMEEGLGEKRFRRVIEDFTCFNCGTEVRGKGYTDHCPNCLWSLHVDNFPGDRKAACKGKMEPVSAVYEKDNYTISYVCQKCGMRRKFKAAPEDKNELLLSLIGSKGK
jgi:rubrerythrin